MVREAKADGHDALIIKNFNDGRTVDSTAYIAFDPKQVKSATGNSGKFDPNSPSLTDPLLPGERSPRQVTARSDGTNAIPPADSVTVKPVGVPRETSGADGEAVSLDAQRVAQIAEESPGLKVRLPGSDETITVTEALTRAKEEAAAEAKEADLVKAAMDCALS
jgi:hypothetical protein